MSLTHLLAQYGYLALFIGCVLEGETILILAGFAAHQGYLSLPAVLVTAASGGMLGDLLFFTLGHRYGAAVIERFPSWQDRAQQVRLLLLRYHAGVIIGIRFMYGLRIVGPVVIGASEVPPWRFVLFNLIGAVLWASLIGGAGYLFGHALQWLLTDLKHSEEAVLLFVIVAAVLLTLARRWRSHRH
ncbi:DedA family protein [Neisseriaceae bacterium JH1-16]|nr:DedA family protein [Neisseriaceae bacterium JH1-16]